MLSATQLYQQGIQAYRAASLETAADLFSQAINLGAKSAKLFDARASAYEKLGRLQEGLLDAKEVVKLMPDSHKGYLRAAMLLKAATKYANAEKLLLQGLERVPQTEEKGRKELEQELEVLREVKAKAEHSPYSQLPMEIFLDIIQLATSSPPCTIYGSSELPRLKPANGRHSTLFAAMRVCRTWYTLIRSTPALWHTLRLDGVINGKNAERKACYVLGRACGIELKPSSSARLKKKGGCASSTSTEASRTRTIGGTIGLRRLVLTAAQDFPHQTFSALLSLLVSTSAASTLSEIVLSFVDGSLTTVSAEAESTRSTQLLVFLHEHARTSLTSLSLCSAGRVYPDFDLANMYGSFEKLATFRLCGTTTSNFVFGLRAPFLLHASPAPSPPSSSSSNSSPSSALTRTSTLTTRPISPSATHLTVLGAVLTDSPLSRHSFPNLRTLELDILNAPVMWDVLSCPSLTRYHAVVYGESHVVELEMPDLENAWRKVEDLRLGGAKRLVPRLLDQAVVLGPLKFPYLTTLDLSFASLTSAHLEALFSSLNAPLLTDLNLASTTVPPPPIPSSSSSSAHSSSRTLTLPSSLTSLKALNLSHTLWTTDDTLRSLITSAPKLERLRVRGNAFITGRPVMELVRARFPPSPPEGEEKKEKAEGKKEKKYSLLTALALEGCTKIDTPAVEWLKTHVRPGGVRFQFVEPGEKGGGGRRGWERFG
ncbi:hypothetical protein JCM8547_004173 [Rhodosporidiobolus lusitaniae]